MTRIAYFDTNVFDHIHKGIGVGQAEYLALRSAVNERRTSVALSVLNLEEALCLLPQSHDRARDELRLILELSESERLIRPPATVLSNDIRSYGQGNPAPPAFMALDSAIRENLRALIDADEKEARQLAMLVKEIQKEKEVFLAGMREAGAQVSPHAKAVLRASNGKPMGWQAYWDSLAGKFAEGFAAREGMLDACRERGIAGLLDLPGVRMAVGASLSFAYAETFESRTPKIGDSRDMQHAVMATAADVFVTHDERLARLLARIPGDGFQLCNLQAFLQGL